MAQRGGTFAFCDTDSLGIVLKRAGSCDVPGLSEPDTSDIIAKFDRLNPYKRNRCRIFSLLEQNDEWQLQRRYLSLGGLGAISDKQTQRSSAVVTGASRACLALLGDMHGKIAGLFLRPA